MERALQSFCKSVNSPRPLVRDCYLLAACIFFSLEVCAMSRKPSIPIGTRIHKLVVVQNDLSKYGKVASLCKCDCGKEILLPNSELRSGRRISCGCYQNTLWEKNRPNVGDRIGRLVVEGISFAKDKRGKVHSYCSCKCDCGKTIKVLSYSLISGNTSSCGCLHKEQLVERCLTHGDTHTRLYHIHCAIMERCTSATYKDYFGRGIRVCDEWKDYETFKAWAMKTGYNDEMSIERIDVNGNYCPSNCTWIPRNEQAKNRRNCHFLEVEGKKMCLSDAARFYGLKPSTVIGRWQEGKRGADLFVPIKLATAKTVLFNNEATPRILIELGGKKKVSKVV